MDHKFKNLSILYPEEGARAKFENLVAQALCTIYPETHQIRTTRGDRGIDIFQGTLRPSPGSEIKPLKIYQCKYFPDRIDASRQRHIKESLLRAYNSYPHLDTWVLCVPCNLSNEESEWWQRFQKEEGNGLRLELYDENKLLGLLEQAGLKNELSVTPPERILAPGMIRSNNHCVEGSADSSFHFVGRKRELSQIRAQFEESKSVVLLSGIAGIGKSELAKHFFEISGDLFHYAQFIFIDEKRDEQEGLLQIVLQKLRFSLAFERSCIGQRPEEQLRLRQSALAELPQTSLLIIDNANDLTEKDLHMLLDFPCRFLITTRKKIDQKDNNRIGFISVEEMTSEDLVKVFEKKYGPVGEAILPELEKLFEKIAHHTMTVELIATLMRSQSMEVHEIINTITSFDKNNNKINYSHNYSEKENITILEHLQALFDLSQTTEEEILLLQNLALISNCGIDSEMLKTWLGLENNNIFFLLAERGWIKFDSAEKHVQLHPLISRLCFVAFPPTLDTCGGLIQGVKEILRFENCEMISEVQAIMTYGEFLADRLKEAGIQEPELLVRLANGYAILGEEAKSKVLALSLAERSTNLVSRAQAVILVGRLGLTQLSYKEVADWYERNRLCLTAPEQWQQRAILLMQLGECYHELDDIGLAQKRLLECFNLYIEHESVIGAGTVLMNILLYCKSSWVFRSPLLRSFKRLCYQKARENPIGFLLYFDCKVLAKISGGNQQISSLHQIIDEFMAYASRPIPFLKIEYIVRHQYRILQKCGNIHMADIFKVLFSESEEYSKAQIAAIWEIQTELRRQCETVGITADIFNSWSVLFDYFPEVNTPMVLMLLENAFKEYEKQLFVSYYNVIPALINYARVKGLMIGSEEGVAQLKYLIELQVERLPPMNQCYLATTYEALGDMYARMDQWIGAKTYYKKVLMMLQNIDAVPSEIARLYYKLDYPKKALELLESNSIYNCIRCRVYQHLGNKARLDGNLEQMQHYFIKLRQNAHRFKGCSNRCYAEILVECGDSITCTSQSGLPYYGRAYLIGRRLRQPFSRAADNSFFLAQTAYKYRAKIRSKQLVVYSLNCGIKCGNMSICQGVLCFYIVNNWDVIWRKFFRKTAWRLYRKQKGYNDDTLLLLLRKYLSVSRPSPFEYIQALKDLYTECIQECNMNNYIGGKDLVVSKLLSSQMGQALIKDADSGKQLLCDAQEYILNTFLCETLSLGIVSGKGSLNAFKELIESIQRYVEHGKICAAEDLLFAYCTERPFENLDLIAEDFYQRLEEMSDDDLIAAQFSREEISEGYRDFFRLWNKRPTQTV